MVVADTDGDGYLVIDGQHRYLAAKELGLKRVPTMVVPNDIARRMLTLNVEKEPNIRERSAVALNIYRDLVEKEPAMKEDDARSPTPCSTLRHARARHAEYRRLAGSQYESILKKCDSYMKSR